MQNLPIIVGSFVAVLALVGLLFWAVRRFGSGRTSTNSQRGRVPRLAIVDATPIDNNNRRRLVLVRRDNVEHLLMIGGPTDIVVETNIVRTTPAREQLPQRAGGAELPRIAPLPEPVGWADEGATAEPVELPEPQMPEPLVPPLPRPVRPSFAEEPRRQAPVIPEREVRAEPVPRAARPEPMMPRPPRHSEPPKIPPVRAPERAAAPSPPSPPPPVPTRAQPTSGADHNLADMAQRLEAALRRPASSEAVAPPVAPEPPAPRPPLEAEPATAPAKSGFDSLEEEMASLLGRPKPSS